jgi:1,2-diacylglycerol 3-alpha-glucosyltransferase
MNIGFVSTWFERGAAYVTKAYISLLEENHNVFVYARGGEGYGKGNPNWDLPYVTWAPRLRGTNINFDHFKKWIQSNDIEIIFFNEQREVNIVYELKKHFPHLKLGSYIDYYKENTVNEFFLYDFLICNTKRHYYVFKEHPQCFYVPWGTDTALFKPERKENDILTFFHSAGMSNRKGTTFVIDAFIKGNIFKKSKLIIHTQNKLDEINGYKIKDLERYNIEVIQKTVPAPGLFYLGDVYVYPTTLDGLGLTMYEALASGLPVITTNHPPMNEVINNNVGFLVDVEYFRSRHDGYYWPLSIIQESSLIKGMEFYVENYNILPQMKENARKVALKNWDWKDREKEVNNIFVNTEVIVNKPKKELIAEQNTVERYLQKIGSSYLYTLLNKFILKNKAK